jgi:hypothetical protein
VVFNFLSIVVWFGLSGITEKINCAGKNVCASSGPALSIASNFLIAPAVGLFIYSYCRRVRLNEGYGEVDKGFSNKSTFSVSSILKITPDVTVLKNDFH